MQLGRDIGKDAVSSGVIDSKTISNLVSNMKISFVQTCYCGECSIDVYISDKIESDTESEFFSEDVAVKTVMYVWGLCNSKVIHTTVQGENIVVVVLRVSDSNKNQYVAIAMFESEFNS